MRNALLLAAVAAAQAAAGAWQDLPPAPRTPETSYELRVTLDPASRQVEGTGRIRWRNTTSRALDELRLIAVWNAWRTPGSTWFVEQPLGGDTSLAVRAFEDLGWVDIGRLDRLHDNGSTDLRGRLRNVMPDDGSPQDRTLFTVPLDVPLAPGEVMTLDLAWSGRVPRPFAHTGMIGDYVLMAHWFPQLAVATDEGWLARQFHAATAAFTGFATFDVSITLPEGWVVGATGREVERHPDGTGSVTHRYTAGEVPTFAWTASPRFIEATAQVPVADGAPVEVRWLLRPEHASRMGQYQEATRRAVAWFAAFAGSYPYRQLTIVDPPAVHHPAQGEPTAGLGYPMLVTVGARLGDSSAGLGIEQQVLRGVAHQFWSAAVAPDGVSHAWMRDGIAEYTSRRAMADLLSRGPAPTERLFGGLLTWAWPGIEVTGNGVADGLPLDALATPSWRAWPGTADHTATVTGARWLATLERVHGRPVLDGALVDYLAASTSAHPSPDDLFAHLAARAGEPIDEPLAQAYREPVMFDYAVAHVDVVTFDDPVNRVIVRRLGDGVFPVDVRVTFADGSMATVAWDGRARWHLLTFPGDARITGVAVDPEHVLRLETARTNNTWTSRPRARAAATRWAARWMAWLQEVLVTYALVA